MLLVKIVLALGGAVWRLMVWSLCVVFMVVVLFSACWGGRYKGLPVPWRPVELPETSDPLVILFRLLLLALDFAFWVVVLRRLFRMAKEK